jgi:F-type H+-transporting ATPase subunit delta
MRVRDSHRRTARRIWLACLQDGVPQPAAVRAVVEALSEHGERGGEAVLQAFGERLRRYERLHSARVESATALDPAAQQAVRELLLSRPQRVESVEFCVDPGLIAGLRTQIGFTVYDGSVRGRLERLGHALQDG